MRVHKRAVRTPLGLCLCKGWFSSFPCLALYQQDVHVLANQALICFSRNPHGRLKDSYDSAGTTLNTWLQKDFLSSETDGQDNKTVVGLGLSICQPMDAVKILPRQSATLRFVATLSRVNRR